ncbi:MAG: tetratricopeptide repeat protein [Cyanobacteria bacterium SZAS LIN-3]|nr:tetratricopeptide repeat protein [Cyanobacteria bacterium SZAS LIN-3]
MPEQTKLFLTARKFVISTAALSLSLMSQSACLADPAVVPVGKVLEAIGEKSKDASADASPTKPTAAASPKTKETDKAAEKPKPPTPNEFFDQVAKCDPGDNAKMKELCDKAIALFDKTGTRDDRYALCTSNLAAIELKSDDLKAAEAHLKQSLDASQGHVITATNYQMVGDIKAKQDRLVEAEAAYGGVLEIFSKYGDPNHQEATVLEKLAGIYDRMGRSAQASATRLKATDLATFQAGEKGAQSAYKLGTKALIANDYKEAIKQFEESLKIQPDFKAAKMNLAICYQHEALEHQRKKEYGEAESNYLQALPAMEAAFGPKHTYTCTVLQGLCETFESENKLDDAEKQAAHWVDIEREVHNGAPVMMNALRIYSRILKANKKQDQAVAAEKELSDMEAKDKASKPQFAS